MTANSESFDVWSAPADDPVLDIFQARPRVSTPQPLDIVLDDWDVLYGAVTSRLGLLVGEPESLSLAGSADAHWQAVRAGVLDCVAALAQVRSMLALERARGRGLESALFKAQTTLASVHVELAGTRAGERQARHRAMHDSLTSLPNRACFRERLEQSIARADPGRETLAVMYIDLDGFKAVNDVHGHAIGDELLCIVGKRLTRAMRADDAVSRQGGDEFACLLSVVPPCTGRLERLACELFDVVAEPVQLDELQLGVRPSIGIAVWPADGLTAEDLLRHADSAMYRAKRGRCGHAFYDGHEGPAPRQPGGFR